MSDGFRSAWCPVSYPEGPILAMTESRERPVNRFKDMTREELLEAGRRGVPRSQALDLLTAGYFKGLCDERDMAKLKELLDEEEADRKRLEESARFRAAHAGLSECEVAVMVRKGGVH